LRKHSSISHFSVPRKGTDEAHSALAQLTLKYLLLDDFSDSLHLCTSDIQLDGEYRFYKYCALYWFEHTYNVKHEDQDLLELVDRFIFGSPRHLRSYETMIKMYYNPGKSSIGFMITSWISRITQNTFRVTSSLALYSTKS
jgi:hypothetical protein